MKYALESLKNDCKSCYKCIRGCPTKSISFIDNQATILHNDCILCGSCFLRCPQNAKEIRNDIPLVKELLKNNRQVIVSVAPSFIANYSGASIDTFNEAMKKLGFFKAEETAVGATIVKKAYDQILKERKVNILISSCCHSINLLLEKHHHEILKYLAPVLSPMLAHAKDIKERYPEAKVVYIGPCISKKDEADSDEFHYVDQVLTFIELDELLQENNISIAKEKNSIKINESKARLFPTTGGIIKSMDANEEGYNYIAVDGIENCIEAIKDIENGKINHCFIEMSSCSGSCINGPALSKNARAILAGNAQVVRSAGPLDFEVSDESVKNSSKKYEEIYLAHVAPKEEDIQRILKLTGKNSKSDELNCGSCGYDTCRDKAIAVLNGKAVSEMCLPFLMEKATSFSSNVVSQSPNGLFVLDNNFKVELINKTMLKLLDLKDEKEIIGHSIKEFLDPKLYDEALLGIEVKNIPHKIEKTGKFVEETVTFDPKYNIIISTVFDITEEEKQKEAHSEFVANTIKVTNEVIEKNMRTVQEIASLLGESAAETKIALQNLKGAVSDDKKD